eukprot:m.172672 g.172672  ORF g.172672 m.172672 type:complete len:159 (+) comp14580_c0_seq15:6748-7224(+)
MMCVGTVTRSSVRTALQFGITARQILHYMQANSSDILKQKQASYSKSQYAPIPQNVSDQVLLWELETCRVRKQDAVLVRGLEPDIYQQVRSAMVKAKGAVWYSDTRQLLLIKPSFKGKFKEYCEEAKHAVLATESAVDKDIEAESEDETQAFDDFGEF